MAMLFIVFSACTLTGLSENGSKNETDFAGQSPSLFSASEETADILNLSYIWSISGIEDGPVIMLLHQNKSDLYGQAEYEPDSGQAWNGMVIGSVKGDRVNLVITYQKNNVLYTNRLNGTYDPASESIAGDLLQVKDGKISRRSEFNAMWFNPDISSYIPVQVTLPSTMEPSANSSSNAASGLAPSSSLTASSMAAPPQKSRYHDVREDADRILTGVGDISQIPIGMGGSGLP
jgi:hypothetical protein